MIEWNNVDVCLGLMLALLSCASSLNIVMMDCVALVCSSCLLFGAPSNPSHVQLYMRICKSPFHEYGIS